MSGRDVYPDQTLLQQIFGEEVSENRIVIILQTWDKCVFKVHAADPPEGERSRAVVVRLESASQETNHQFAVTAVIQKLASETIPGFVPSINQHGKASNRDGREFCFAVVHFVDGVTLESIWADLNLKDREIIVSELSGALQALHSTRISERKVQGFLRLAATETTKDAVLPLRFGGARTGVLSEGAQLLDKITERRKLKRPFCSIEKDDERKRITVRSQFDDVEPVTLEYAEMEQWAQQSVFCHNDLTPRNILLKKSDVESAEEQPEYRLAAIIDWELAGFYPAAYELQLQDTYLGGGNRHASFYQMLKKAMKSTVPENKAQMGLFRAMELIFESQQRSLLAGSNIPARIRKRFLEFSHLTRDHDLFSGWTSTEKSGQDCDTVDIQKIEDDVISEVMAERAAKRG